MWEVKDPNLAQATIYPDWWDSLFFLSLSCKCHSSTLNQSMTVSFHNLSTPPLINHVIIWAIYSELLMASLRINHKPHAQFALILCTLCKEHINRNIYLFMLFVAGIFVSEWQWCRREFSHFNLHQDSTRRIWCSVALAILPLCLFHSLWSVKHSWECKHLSCMLL